MNDKRIKRSAAAFPDTNLEVAIRKNINKPQGPIYASDLEPLTELDLENNNISDISALAGLNNLKILTLKNNNIRDISAMAGLSNLLRINLEDNNISDISALAGLSNLEWLNLWKNNISDISALAGLSSLQELHLSFNNISDISALVNNVGLLDGDTVFLGTNPLSPTSINVYIPQLQARGIFVSY